MKLPWTKPQDNYVYVWESQPYNFEPGLIYVIEVKINEVSQDEIASLQRFFLNNGVNVKIINSGSGKALNPIVATRKKEIKK